MRDNYYINKKLRTLSKRVPRIKNNEGISLISLVVTLIVLIILVSITVNNLSDTSEKAVNQKILNEFIEIENAVKIQEKMITMDSTVHSYVGTKLTKATQMTINNKLYGEGYYLLKEKDLIELGVDSSSKGKSYIVNYSTGEVVVTDPFIINKRPVYTKIEVLSSQTSSFTYGVAEYDKTKGVNKPYLYEGMLPVKQDEGRWVVCSVNDTEWYDYVINGNGPIRYANVMLMDDIILYNPETAKTIPNEKVRATPIEQLVGCRVVIEGSMFVWVPRYTYKASTGEITYSYLTSDYLLDGFVKAPAFYNGEYQGATTDNANAGYVANGTELTGIWISKYQASYSND